MRLDFHLSEQNGGPHILSSLSNWLYTSSYVLEFATFAKIIQSRCWDLIQRKFLVEIMVPLRANIYLSTIFNSWKLKTIRRLERTFHLPLVWERWFFEVNLLIFTDGWNYCNAFIIQKLFIRKESRKQEKYANNNFWLWLSILFDLWVCVNVVMDSLIMIMLTGTSPPTPLKN